MLHPFHFLDLFQPSTVPVAPIELRPEEDTDQVCGERRAHNLGAEAEDVHVVVLDALMCRIDVVADCGANSVELVRRDGGSDAGSTDEHASLCVAGEQNIPESESEVRIVDPGLRAFYAQVD